MEPRSVLSYRKTHPRTPLNAREWELALERTGLATRYPLLVSGLMNGFYVNAPIISRTFTPPNSPSLDQLKDHFNTIVDNEFRKERYIGPFSRTDLESLIGPFQSSPQIGRAHV